MMLKKIRLFIACAFMMVMIAGSAMALGMSPARTEIFYEEGRSSSITFNIINNENKDMRLLVYAEGEHAGHILLPEKTIEVSRHESMVQFHAVLDMGTEIAKKPGKNKIDIKVMELPEGSQPDQDQVRITSTVEVVHQVWVNVPYPGKYAEVPDVYITTPQSREYTLFTLPVYNRGKEDLDDIHAVIEIYSPYGDMKSIVETDILALKSGSSGKLEARVYEDQRGRYRALIRFYYAGQETVIEREFFVGVESVDLVGVTVDRFTLGQIAKFNLILENFWNQKISDIYADVRITDSQNRLMTVFKTSSVDLEAGSTGITNAYWDTGDADPGAYNMHVVVNYASLFTEKWFVMDVGFDSIRIRGAGLSGAVVAGSSSSPKISMLWLMFLLLVLTNIVLAVFIYRSRRKRSYYP